MANTVYIDKPGGVLLHHEDGQVKYAEYGEEIDPSILTDYQRKTLKQVTSDSPRSESPGDRQVKEAHRAAVDADLGQVNSTTSPIPSNYHELDEDGAIALINALKGFPSVQAKIALYERVNFGREKVLDAVSDEAQELADAEYEQLQEGVGDIDAVAAAYQLNPSDDTSEVEVSEDGDPKPGRRTRKAQREQKPPEDGEAPPPES
jgi:hypothetical protein